MARLRKVYNDQDRDRMRVNFKLSDCEHHRVKNERGREG